MLGVETKERELEGGGGGEEEEEERRMTGGGGREAARRRWAMLAAALRKAARAEPKKRRIFSFGLVDVDRWGEQEGWLRYSVGGGRYSVMIKHVWPRPVSPKQLVGFNNTGNLCVWPSEEVLAHYLLREGVLERLRGKSVLELGGGMTCLAGLFVAKYGRPARVQLTDGNTSSVDNVRTILEANRLTGVGCSTLVWGRETPAEGEPYDLILAADCLFFDDARDDLVDAMWDRLGEDGTALVTAPRRGRTLDLFLDGALRRGFGFDLLEHYDPAVWERHLLLQDSCPYYDPDVHYPVLIRLAKTSAPVKPPPFDLIIPS